VHLLHARGRRLLLLQPVAQALQFLVELFVLLAQLRAAAEQLDDAAVLGLRLRSVVAPPEKTKLLRAFFIDPCADGGSLVCQNKPVAAVDAVFRCANLTSYSGPALIQFTLRQPRSRLKAREMRLFPVSTGRVVMTRTRMSG
jgi:hypothetical protein